MRYAWKIPLLHLKSPPHAFLKSRGGLCDISEVWTTLKNRSERSWRFDTDASRWWRLLQTIHRSSLQLQLYFYLLFKKKKRLIYCSCSCLHLIGCFIVADNSVWRTKQPIAPPRLRSVFTFIWRSCTVCVTNKPCSWGRAQFSDSS